MFTGLIEEVGAVARRSGDELTLVAKAVLEDLSPGDSVAVDGVGRILSMHPQGQFALWRFQAPAEVARYLVPKGSVAVDGISLTVVEPEGDTFGVALIPTTLQQTTLGRKRPGDAVNLEADMIGKHIYHYLKGLSGGGGLTLDKLSRFGFA